MSDIPTTSTDVEEGTTPVVPETTTPETPVDTPEVTTPATEVPVATEAN